jgi:hypothetical protein
MYRATVSFRGAVTTNGGHKGLDPYLEHEVRANTVVRDLDAMAKAFYGAEVWARSELLAQAVMKRPQMRKLEARFKAGKCEDQLYEPLTEVIQTTMDYFAQRRRSDARPISPARNLILSAADTKIFPSRFCARDNHRNTLEGTNSDFKFVLVSIDCCVVCVDQ